MSSVQENDHLLEMETKLVAASEQMLDQGRGIAFNVLQYHLQNTVYVEFLESQGIDITTLTSPEALQSVPLIDKRFLQGKTIPELCPNFMEAVYAYSESSGMTGEPVQIPRLTEADAGIMPAIERMWTDYWEIDKKSTHTVVGWAMGTWVAGTLMDGISKELSKKGYPIGVTTPGADVRKAADMIKIHSANYDQTIFQGYPPFVAEVINLLEEEGVDLKALDIKLFIAGEPMSEEWRKLMQRKLGGDDGEQDLTRVVSLYGTAEGGVMGVESRISTLVRKLAHEDPVFAQALFGELSPTPMIFQTPPQAKWMEDVDGEIVFTGITGIPSVRYNMHDKGRVVPFKDMMAVAKEHGYNLFKLLAEAGYRENPIAPFPFVCVDGRSDGGVSIDGGNIYPADMDRVLIDNRVLALGVNEYMLDVDVAPDTGQMRLKVHLELKEGFSAESIGETELIALQQIIMETIACSNPDYRKSLADNPVSATPVIELHGFGQGMFEVNGRKLKKTREADRAR